MPYSLIRSDTEVIVTMTDFQKEILSLVNAALRETEPTGVDLKRLQQIFHFAEVQQMVGTLYYGLMGVPGFMEHPENERFMSRYCGYLGHDASQMEALESIFAAFEKEGITYMPLKGTVLKGLYPCFEMRTMGDADILIRPEEYKRVTAVMRRLGCEFEGESDHEYNWCTADGHHIELHKHLIPSYNKDYYAYYGDGWQLARPCEGSQYRHEMRPEDTFIYLFTHFAKHYRDQGVGMKYVVDFYVFKEYYPNLNWRYVEAELEKLMLSEFYLNVMYMVSVWFEGAPATELSDFMTEKIFSFGVFGNSELNALSEGVKLTKDGGSAKSKKKWQMFFPPYATMCLLYPVLKNWAILLPLFWLVRLVDRALHHRDRYRSGMAKLETMSEESIRQYQQELNYVGLDYHFGKEDPPPKGE